MSRTLWEANTGFSKNFVEGYLCKDGKPISLSTYYKGDENMRNETTDRDPRLKQTILSWDFPTRVTLSTNDSTFIEEESKFIDQYCYTGYKSIKYFIPTDKAFEANNNTYDGIAYRYAETLLINAEAKAELGTISQADLDKTINVLRDRVGMPHLTINVGFTDPNWTKWGYDLSPLLQEIRRERRVELAGEGFRWDDLMRWKAGKICDNVKTYVGKRQPEKVVNMRLYILIIRMRIILMKPERAVHGMIVYICVRFLRQNFNEILVCFLRIRDGINNSKRGCVMQPLFVSFKS